MAISARQFEQIQARLSGRKSADSIDVQAIVFKEQIIIGVDPSLRGTGFGVVHVTRTASIALDHGTIACPPSWTRSRCLVKIIQTLRDVVARHHPQVCAIEGLFYAQNIKTALIMGEARGAALAAVAEAGLDIYEIAPRKVKQAIVGYGAAQKLAVSKMIQRMLQLAEAPGPDAADALAIALAHAQDSRRTFSPAKKI